MDLERAQRLVKLRSHGRCEGCFQPEGLLAACHHRQARGMGGVHSVAATAANDPRNLLRLCGSCHAETEHDETWRLTEEIGWRIPKYVTNPYAVPALLRTVNYAGPHWFLLDQDGGYTWLDAMNLPAVPQATWVRQPEDPLHLAAYPGSVSASRQRLTYGT